MFIEKKTIITSVLVFVEAKNILNKLLFGDTNIHTSLTSHYAFRRMFVLKATQSGTNTITEDNT